MLIKHLLFASIATLGITLPLVQALVHRVLEDTHLVLQERYTARNASMDSTPLGVLKPVRIALLVPSPKVEIQNAQSAAEVIMQICKLKQLNAYLVTSVNIPKLEQSNARHALQGNFNLVMVNLLAFCVLPVSTQIQ
tara:strand:+ start:82 stop:492 length:411 start_codon:yes stop_codon:yes gene_type:complete